MSRGDNSNAQVSKAESGLRQTPLANPKKGEHKNGKVP
jgi:hypothetical protein